MKKFLSIFLTLAMLFGMISAAGFQITLPASAADPDVNLAAGKSYTYRTVNHQNTDADGNVFYDPSVNDEITITPADPDDWLSKGFDDQYFHSRGCSDENGTGTALTDGIIRDTSELNPGDSVDVKRVELIGAYRTHEIDIDLEDAYTVNTMFLPNVRRGGNRYANVVSIEVKVDGVYEEVDFSQNAVVAATVMAADDPSALMCRGEEDAEPDHQYYDVTLTFPSVDNVTNVRITFDTNFAGNNSTSIQPTDSSRAYVLALEEIEIYNRDIEPDESSDWSYDETSEYWGYDETSEEFSNLETYTVTIFDNGDGTYTVTAALPAGILAGLIVVSASDKLTYVEGSIDYVAGGISNTAYDRHGVKGQCVSFASSLYYIEGIVVFSAVYRAVDGAEITADDITVPYWHLSNGIQYVGTSETGDVIKVFVPHEHFYDSYWWYSDYEQHWHECACGDRADVAYHVFDNDCDMYCNICGGGRPIAHRYSEEWSSDGMMHWHECTVCGNKTDAATHTYDDAFDSDCNICGARRIITGDVNQDGAVNNIDASVVLRYDAGIYIPASNFFTTADVNRDNAVNNIDASRILQFDAGIINNFSGRGINYALGATYTAARDGTYDDTEDGRDLMYLSYYEGSTAYSDIDHTRLNDGVVTPGAELDPRGNGTDGKTVCYIGTDANFNVDFELAKAYDDISTIVFRNVRDGIANGNNRGFVVKMVQVSDDGMNWTRVKHEETSRVQVMGAPYIPDADYWYSNVEHFDITYTLDYPASARFVRIYFSNNGGYIAQFDEIEIYGE